MSLKFSYTLLAPLYDSIVGRGSQSLRKQSLAELNEIDLNDSQILIDGIGSGLDIPYLPVGPNYTGIDLTPKMLDLARQRITSQPIALHEGNALDLPYEDEHFDAVIMHLILAVVPRPNQALIEAERVLKPGGTIIIIDKFLKPGQRAPIRRMLNPIISRIATNTNIVFEDIISNCPTLRVKKDIPSLANGWFRQIVLQKLY